MLWVESNCFLILTRDNVTAGSFNNTQFYDQLSRKTNHYPLIPYSSHYHYQNCREFQLHFHRSCQRVAHKLPKTLAIGFIIFFLSFSPFLLAIPTSKQGNGAVLFSSLFLHYYSSLRFFRRSSNFSNLPNIPSHFFFGRVGRARGNSFHIAVDFLPALTITIG